MSREGISARKWSGTQEQMKDLEGLSLDKKRLRRNLLALYNSQTGECSQVGVRLCSQETRDTISESI